MYRQGELHSTYENKCYQTASFEKKYQETKRKTKTRQANNKEWNQFKEYLNTKRAIVACSHQENVELNHNSMNLRFKRLSIQTVFVRLPYLGWDRWPVTKTEKAPNSAIQLYSIFRLAESGQYLPQVSMDGLLAFLKGIFQQDKRFRFPKDSVETQITENLNSLERAEMTWSKAAFEPEFEPDETRMVVQCVLSKESSLNVQRVISEGSAEQIRELSAALTNHIAPLITHKLASYVLQKLALKDAAFRADLEAFCRAEFWQIASDEFASRVMQILIEASTAFWKFVNDQLSSDLAYCMGHSSINHLLVVCIKRAPRQSDIHYILEFAQQHRFWLGNLAFQRILKEFVQRCSLSDLDRVAILLKIQKNCFSMLNNKVLTQILLHMLQRSAESVIALWEEQINSNLASLMETKFFKLLISKLWEFPTSQASRRFAVALASLSVSKKEGLRNSAQTLSFFYYLALKSLRLSEPTRVNSYLLETSTQSDLYTIASR